MITNVDSPKPNDDKEAEQLQQHLINAVMAVHLDYQQRRERELRLLMTALIVRRNARLGSRSTSTGSLTPPVTNSSGTGSPMIYDSRSASPLTLPSPGSCSHMATPGSTRPVTPAVF